MTLGKDLTDQKDTFLLDEVSDLTVIELMILQFLVRYQSPIVRYVLLDTLNGVLTSKKLVKPSSFYQRVDKLEKRGFISKRFYNEDSKTGAIKEVEKIQITPMGRMIISEMLRITAMASFDWLILCNELIPKFEKTSGISEVPLFLIINLEDGTDVRMLELIGQFGENSYILSDDDSYMNFQARGLGPHLKLSYHFNGKIREMNEFFDCVLLLGYDKDKIYENYPMIEWLREGMRVLREDGIMAIASVDKLPDTDHFIADTLLSTIAEGKYLHMVGIQELRNDLKVMGIENPQIIRHKGLLLGWGNKLL